MNKNFYFLLAFLLTSTFLKAQIPNYKFALQSGSLQNDAGKSIVADGQGNIYVTGYFSGSNVKFSHGTGTQLLTAVGNSDIFIAKYDTSGNLVWAESMGGPGADQAYSIALDHSGNIVVVGNFSQTADFDPGANTANLSTGIGKEIFIAKYTSAGQYVWAESIGGSGNDFATSVICDQTNDNIYVCGAFESSAADFDPSTAVFYLGNNGTSAAFVANYSPAGAFLWANAIAGTLNNYANAMALDASANLYVCGYFNGTNVNFNAGGNPINLSSNGLSDIFIAKYSSTGLLTYAKNIGGSGNDFGLSIKLDQASNFYISGSFESSNVDFDPSAASNSLSSNGGFDAFLGKYTCSSSDNLWAVSYGDAAGNDDASSIAINSDNDVIVSGRFSGSATDLNPGTGVQTMTNQGATDIYFSKFKNDGTFKWAFSIGGLNDEIPTAITAYNGSIFSTGYVQSAGIDYDPSTAVASDAYHGAAEMYCARFAEVAEQVIVNPTGILESASSHSNTLSVFPNPSSGAVTIRTSQASIISVINLNGKLVTMQATSGSNGFATTITGLQPGIYLAMDQNRHATKFVVE